MNSNINVTAFTFSHKFFTLLKQLMPLKAKDIGN